MSANKTAREDPMLSRFDGMDRGDDGDTRTSTPWIPVQKLSCDHCRARKVRCDRIEPCTPCIRKQLNCTFPGGCKPREKRRHALLSNSYEGKIDEISSKLDQICSAIDSISIPSHHSRRTWTPTTSSLTQAESSSVVGTNDEDNVSGGESDGEMSLKAHTAYATEFVQQVVDSTCTGSNPDIMSSIDALRRIVETNKQRSKKSGSLPPAKLVDVATGEDLKMPLLEMAMTCLGMLREHDRIKLLWCFEIESVGEFVEYFLSCYSKQPAMTDLIIVNAGLARLFHQCSRFEPESKLKAEYEAQATACQRNIEILIPQIPFTAPYTFDLALALSMASVQYMDMSKPGMAWRLATQSASICRLLGFNRGESLKIEASAVNRRQKRLFLVACIMEKHLAFRLGKASTIRSCEIPPIDIEISDGFAISMSPLWRKWIRISLLQDQVYDDLYSPQALLQPDSVRETRARALAEEIQKAIGTDDAAELRCIREIQDVVGEPLSDLCFRADKISTLALLTLVYRAIPADLYSGTAFSELCVSTALEALEEHHQCMRQLQDQEYPLLDFYVQWALLSAPFVPYIVIFCLAVETSSPLYLAKLASVVDAIEKATTGYLEAHRKQLVLFRLMYDVAYKCVEPGSRSGSAGAARTQARGASSEMYSLGDSGMSMPSPTFQFDHDTGFHSLAREQRSTEADQTGTRMSGGGLALGTWMDQNYQIFAMLDDDMNLEQ